MARFWQRFYTWQVLALAGSGVLLALLFHYSPLDLWLTDRWYDAASGTWPYRHARWAEQWIHHHLRLLLLAVALVCGWLCWRHRAA